jgi:hypothetical protein
MKKNFILLALAGFSIIYLPSCEQKAEESTAVIAEEAAVAPESEMATTEISFFEKEHDFGLIVEGEMVGHTFKFTNTGSAPLKILDARASCGCTVPEWTKEPIAPGGEGQLEVKYNSSGKSGVISKTVTVLANTEPKETVLEIKANVKSIDKDLNGPMKK